MSKPLEGKIAAVTGAASGIGLATTRALIDAGAMVVMVDYNQAGARDLCRGAGRSRGHAGHRSAGS
jgi:NAD(P)-dependent dehydrogenase (short-subunit alcohol dehydrogenase family)